MQANGYGAQTLKLITDLHQQGISRMGVIMRHSARERITSEENVLSMGLTEQGRQNAYRFGEKFPSGACVRVFSSPVERCRDTAACIADGYRAQGGSTATLRVVDDLGPFYIIDSPTVFRMTAEAGSSRFLRQWFSGEIAPEIMMPAPQAADILLRAMLAAFRENHDELPALCISHDWNIFLLKDYYLGLPHEEFGDVHFLEGMLLYERQRELYLAHHHGEAKQIDVTNLHPKTGTGNGGKTHD